MPGQVNITCYVILSFQCNLRPFFSILFASLLQWEFQVGPAVGISAGDELWVARYILEVICAKSLFFSILLLTFVKFHTHAKSYANDVRN